MHKIAAFIRMHLPLLPAPFVPEICLHLAQPTSRLGRKLAELGIETSPYWAYAWGGGIALARHLLANPHLVKGHHVLDFGTGSGLAAIAAALGGAASVTAADVDPLACLAAEINAQAGGVRISTTLAEAIPPSEKFDVVLAGDVFYAPDVARHSLAGLERFRSAGAVVLIGDPGRHDLPLHRLSKLASLAVPDFGSRTGRGSEAAVYELIGCGP